VLGARGPRCSGKRGESHLDEALPASARRREWKNAIERSPYCRQQAPSPLFGRRARAGQSALGLLRPRPVAAVQRPIARNRAKGMPGGLVAPALFTPRAGGLRRSAGAARHGEHHRTPQPHPKLPRRGHGGGWPSHARCWLRSSALVGRVLTARPCARQPAGRLPGAPLSRIGFRTMPPEGHPRGDDGRTLAITWHGSACPYR
jgi:hypothetical protein